MKIVNRDGTTEEHTFKKKNCYMVFDNDSQPKTGIGFDGIIKLRLILKNGYYELNRFKSEALAMVYLHPEKAAELLLEGNWANNNYLAQINKLDNEGNWHIKLTDRNGDVSERDFVTEENMDKAVFDEQFPFLRVIFCSGSEPDYIYYTQGNNDYRLYRVTDEVVKEFLDTIVKDEEQTIQE